jgi:enoyl-CoA hydratase
MSYEFITVEQKGRVGVITLNRPKQLNALSPGLMKELGQALAALDADAGIGAIVLTGNEKAFAAGADIAAMKDFSYMHAYLNDYITDWEHFRSVRKPVIGAVAGYALGGGNELAMQCDIVIAAENAKFGQPEINLGIMPGLGGTQRLPRLVGTNKALEMNLTGDPISADEAYEFGLVNRVVPDHELLDTALAWARKLAGQAPLSVQRIKRVTADPALDAGIQSEIEAFVESLSSEDGREGVAAFLEKRQPQWRGA